MCTADCSQCLKLWGADGEGHRGRLGISNQSGHSVRIQAHGGEKPREALVVGAIDHLAQTLYRVSMAWNCAVEH